MSRSAGMPSARRRSIPGMTASGTEEAAPALADSAAAPWSTPATPGAADERTAPVGSAASATVRARPADRHQVEDYGTTRLVNFRLPVDLHDRYKRLVREVEASCPKLRHPSLTEVVIALLSEGPSTSAEVAELIRRKRAAEHGAEL